MYTQVFWAFRQLKQKINTLKDLFLQTWNMWQRQTYYSKTKMISFAVS